ncbi:MAG: DUF1343 domain-containing protein [Acidobacteria bacterium]|nr:DUF1343 domain-containing protein [Acidobacteriota bacterium]MCI0627832.1 DUF1343 domain-containing protein [Acidobacteriota bacterium]MCI0721237.1 DUF1343 domain-containing protein [Acidobacteriota bacterium]
MALLAAVLITIFLCLPAPASQADTKVIPGIEVLVAEQLHVIRGKRVGLITNHTGVDRKLRHDIDLLASAPGARLVALFSPEHGIRGAAQAGEKVRSAIDAKTRVPIHSLYGETRRPNAEMLRAVDVLVYDIQDVGSRFYTYISTLGECMQAAAGQKVPFIVLDRPNPLGGEILEGPLLDPAFRSFVGAFAIPVRYGLTPGELASWIKSNLKLDLGLSVVKMKHWTRKQWYDETNLVWVPPSPNIPTIASALVYPGMCLIEGTNLSEGRGTTTPFEIVGAPWIDGVKLAERLNTLALPGVLFRPIAFTPTLSKFSGEACQGVQLHVTDRKSFRPLPTALAVIQDIRRNYSEQFQFRSAHFDRLAGTDAVRKAIEGRQPAAEIVATWQDDLKEFEATRKKFLLYP